MPSDQELRDLADDWKRKGNEAFQKAELEPAIQAYSQGLVQVDRILPPPLLLKAAFLSNRAACYLKQAKLQECQDDCSSALTIMDKENDTKLRGKLLYRRAKALFLQANMPHKKKEEDLQLAAKDVLSLLSFDPTNKEATQLLNTIRTQHAAEKKNNGGNTPMAKTLEAIKKKDDKTMHNIKILLGMLSNDSISATMELGRRQGVSTLLELAQDSSLELKTRYFSLQCLSCAGSHPPFCRTFMKENVQPALSEMMVKSSSIPEEDDVVVGALSVYLRLILHLDRDDPDVKLEIQGTTFLQYNGLVKGLVAAFQSKNIKIIRAAIDVLSTWTAGIDREPIIRASLDNFIDLPIPKTITEVHQLTPQESSHYKQLVYHKKTRDQAWAFDRSKLFCAQGGLDTLIKCTVACEDATLRREMTVAMGKILAALEADDKIKDAIKPFFGYKDKKDKKDEEKEENLPFSIEEINEEDEEEEGKVVEVKDEEVDEKPTAAVSFETKMERTVLATAVLMANNEVGAWTMGSGWPQSKNVFNALVESDQKIAMCLVAELLSAAASVKETRPVVATYLTTTSLKSLVSHPDRDVRSAAAASVAKLGLAEQGTDDVELLGLLEAACYMLEDGELDAKNAELLSSKVPSSNSGAASSLERGIEVMTYLVSKPMVKEELAHGFKATEESKHTGLELLVKAANRPGAGGALSGFGLASTFQFMAVTPLTLRKEGFEGKQMTMEQYDEIQSMQKTQDQKEVEDEEPELKEDSPEQCSARITRMAIANVPQALCQLADGASDQTLSEVILAMNRMATEQSVRGSMLQQGVLSKLIKIDKEEKNPSDLRKKIIRMLRHCIGKLMITTNPGLLTNAQRMGSIKPLVQLVRDIGSSDLQKFEALMALTNIASSGDDAKNKIVNDQGLSTIKFAMFNDHESVKQAATECMCNLVPNEKFMESLREVDELRLWLALASDYEVHFECARAAAGCLAMATGDPQIAKALISIKNFKERMDQTLESGSLEIMHRMLVVILNLAQLGDEFRVAAEEHGLIAFARAYVHSYHDGAKVTELEFSDEDMPNFHATVDVAKQIVKACDSS